MKGFNHRTSLQGGRSPGITTRRRSSAQLNCNWLTVGVTLPFPGSRWGGSSNLDPKWAVRVCFNERGEAAGEPGAPRGEGGAPRLKMSSPVGAVPLIFMGRDHSGISAVATSHLRSSPPLLWWVTHDGDHLTASDVGPWTGEEPGESKASLY